MKTLLKLNSLVLLFHCLMKLNWPVSPYGIIKWFLLNLQVSSTKTWLIGTLLLCGFQDNFCLLQPKPINVEQIIECDVFRLSRIDFQTPRPTTVLRLLGLQLAIKEHVCLYAKKLPGWRVSRVYGMTNGKITTITYYYRHQQPERLTIVVNIWSGGTPFSS